MTVETDDIAVRCREVKKTYGSGDAQVQALRGVDLDVRRNELLMLVGPSGCGKTTLISVIAGILDRDEGQCTVFGEDFGAMGQGRRTEYRGQTIGFVFQSFNLIPTLTVQENAAIPLLINRVPRKQALARSAEVLDRMGLSDKLTKLPAELSGGQQQRIAIARALIHDPKLIVCDEPTSALDHETGHRVMALLKEVAMGQGRSLVIVTHDARIFEFADRIARMDDGHVVGIANGEDHKNNG